MSDREEPKIKRLAATKALGGLMRDYYVELAEAADDPDHVWICHVEAMLK